MRKESLYNKINGINSEENELNNIPPYNDNSIKEIIEETEKQKMMEREKEERKRLKEERAEYKKTLNKFSQINELLITIIAFSIVGVIVSLIFLKINYAIYCGITAYLAYFVGKRLKSINNYDNVLQTLLWNLSESIDDFFEYKIKIDIKSNYINDFHKYSIVFAVIVGLFNSNSVLYPIALLIILLFITISFASKDLDTIIEKKNLILGALIGGFLIKGFIHSVATGSLILDLFNLVLAILFIALFHFLEQVDISEPIE